MPLRRVDVGDVGASCDSIAASASALSPELNTTPQGLALRQPSGAFDGVLITVKAPEGWRSPRRYRAECHAIRFENADIVLGMRFHPVASTVFTRRASQPPKIISPNVTASTPTISQRQSF